jgi:hypothetical protein
MDDRCSHAAQVDRFTANLVRDAQRFEAVYCAAEFLLLLAVVIYIRLPHYIHDQRAMVLRLLGLHPIIAGLTLLVRVYRCINVEPGWGMNMLNTSLDAVSFTWTAMLAGLSAPGFASQMLNIMLSYMLIFVFPFRRALIVVPLCFLVHCVAAVTALDNEIPEGSFMELVALGIGLSLSVAAKRTIELSKWEAFVMLEEKAAQVIHEKVLRVKAEFAREIAIAERKPSEHIDSCNDASGSSSCFKKIPPSMNSAPAILQTALDDTISTCSWVCSSGGDCLPHNAKVWVEGSMLPTPLMQLKTGNRILCYDRLSGNLKHSEISSLEVKEGDTQWSMVSLADGTKLQMTSDHPVQPDRPSMAGSVIGWPAPVRAGDLQPERDSLTVLKIVSVPVDSVRHVTESGPKVSLSVQQPLRHSIFVAGQEASTGGGGGHLQTMCVESADIIAHTRPRFRACRTFIDILDDMPMGREQSRSLSEPPGFFTCSQGQGTDRGASKLPTTRATAAPQSKSTGSSSTAGVSYDTEVVIASALTLAPDCQGTGPGSLLAVPAGTRAPARLSDMLRLRASGLRSLGSLDHGEAGCRPCAHENRHRHNNAPSSCKKGFYCERCHHHEGEIRRHKRSIAREPRTLAARRNPTASTDSPAAAYIEAAAAEAAAAARDP